MACVEPVAAIHPREQQDSDVRKHLKSLAQNAPQSQRKKLLFLVIKIDPHPDTVSRIGQGVFEGADSIDKRARYLSSEMFSGIAKLLNNNQLFFLKEKELEDYPEVAECNFWERHSFFDI